MTTKEIIELLRERETDFLNTESFSKLPGIYAFFFIGNEFPLLNDSVSKHQIIYVGKTESSQEARDAKTHFTSGKTGNSTVRKSIGSILREQDNLIPIPRNESDYTKGRFSHFKFDSDSEEKITNWMRNNLALSFYDYPMSNDLIDKLETEIILELTPILNIDHKNHKNPYKDLIKQLRKKCAVIAIRNSEFNNPNEAINNTIKNKVQATKYGIPVSGTIYIDNITESDFKSRNIRIKVENKYLFPVEKSVNPTSYALNFKAGNIDFIAKYSIGSKDGKSRSGILKLGDSIYLDTLKIKVGINLKISKSKDNKYIIEKL
jgi:hypothetical protein